MTLTISVGLLAVIAASVLLFALVTLFCWRTGMFDDDGLGIGALFTALFYLCCWVVPSLVIALVWSLWRAA
jgi:hypothetical protein